ncbi:hypothetical protein I79_005348 [Cricetulus griseus]|uniref:Uncharacterized protein n=1 Tax=Cricetulus griseus TaxID=10029 RepID=G3H4Y4_CRIGR|nr:hypothetical protein I79_005348 [Cricetulus griseus]
MVRGCRLTADLSVSNKQKLPWKQTPQHTFVSTQQCNHIRQIHTAHQYISNLPTQVRVFL